MRTRNRLVKYVTNVLSDDFTVLSSSRPDMFFQPIERMNLRLLSETLCAEPTSLEMLYCAVLLKSRLSGALD